MPAKKILNYARSRSETTRTYIAYAVTGLVTAVIVVVWIVSLMNKKPETVIPQNNQNQGLEQLKNGINTLSDTASEAIDEVSQLQAQMNREQETNLVDDSLIEAYTEI